jgi:geranylgeranyl diphosphate synthase type I
LKDFFQEQIKMYRPVNSWSKDALTRLYASVMKGKMVRGGMVFLAYALAQKKPDDVCVRLAAAVEIVHTALIVHDDIMDLDELRRGDATLYKQYETLLKKRGGQNPEHIGESLGICAGDIAIFLSFYLLSSLPQTAKGGLSKLISIFAQEITRVGFAQMQDVYSGALDAVPSSKDILRLYCYKTARYTFALPLMLGGLAAGQTPSNVAVLEKFGEHVGIIFQIKDDELGMFGDEQRIGKPVCSDIREGKKTLYYYFLFARATNRERAQLKHIFGNKMIGEKEIAIVRAMIERYKIEEKIHTILSREIKAVRKIVSTYQGSAAQKKMLSELLEYNLNRSK